jgi:hypothetical protein
MLRSRAKSGIPGGPYRDTRRVSTPPARGSRRESPPSDASGFGKSTRGRTSGALRSAARRDLRPGFGWFCGCSLDGNAAFNRRVAPRSKIGTLSGAADRRAATDRSARLAELSSTPPWTQLWIDTGNRYHTPRAIPDPSDTQLIGLGLPIRCSQRTCEASPARTDGCSLYLTPNS